MELNKISDGFVYLALTYPDEPLVDLYNKYQEYLFRKGITDESENFLLVLQAGRTLRESSEVVRRKALEGITFRPMIASEGEEEMMNVTKEKISDLEFGQTQSISVLVKNITSHRSTLGGIYQKLAVRDISGYEACFLAFDNTVQNVSLPCVMKLDLNIGEYNGGITYKVVDYAPDTENDISLFTPKASFDQKAVWNELAGYVGKLRQPFKTLCAVVINQNKAAFMNVPADVGYEETGGILLATQKLVKAADAIASIYGLDHDLMIASALLYYIGDAYSSDALGTQLPDDILIGSGNLAYEKIICGKMAAVELLKGKENGDELIKALDGKDIRLLEHIILSRYSGIKTAIAEAIFLRSLAQATLETREIEKSLETASENEIVYNKKIYSNRLYKR